MECGNISSCYFQGLADGVHGGAVCLALHVDGPPQPSRWPARIPQCKVEHPGSSSPGDGFRLETEQTKLGTICSGGTLDQNVMQGPLPAYQSAQLQLLYVNQKFVLGFLPPNTHTNTHTHTKAILEFGNIFSCNFQGVPNEVY